MEHDNIGTLEQEIRDAFALVNFHWSAFRNARVQETYLTARLEELKWASVVQELKLKAREEQARIREQMREEEKVRREIDRAIRESEKEQEMLRRAKAQVEEQVRHASAEQKAQYEARLLELEDKLRAAEEKNQRALSMAQQTKLGHVYVISNVGAFGEEIYKIGLTRRLVPQDRIDELGDSSVPFPFDVHAVIRSENAPKLEAELHKRFVFKQVNKVNRRKEFFRVSLAEIRAEIQRLGLAAEWTMLAHSEEYRQSLAIERRIKEDPRARQAWVEGQLELEELDYVQALNAEPAVTPMNRTGFLGDSFS